MKSGLDPAPLVVAKSATMLTTPWPPTVNSYWRPHVLEVTPSAKNGWQKYQVVMTLTKRARLFRSEVHVAIRKQLGHARLVPYSTPVRIDVELRAPDRRTRDIDNNLKALLDSFTHAGVWTDDAVVDEITVRRGRQIKDGCAIVLIAPLDQQPDIPDASQPADGEQENFF